MHAAHAHRLAIGWLVAREAGIEPEIPPFGGRLMGKWDGARNLPAMLKAYKPQAVLFYRLRSLCLQLHWHPSAAICGGAERWWQHILEEEILAAICQRVAPEVFPEMGKVPPTSGAISRWWMRRGINPANPAHAPASWALIEAVQSRVFPGRAEVAHPSDEVPLPPAALNGGLSLQQRKSLLRDLTGSPEGWRPNAGIELYADWTVVLTAWQSTAKEPAADHKLPRYAPLTPEGLDRYNLLAAAFHDALMPTWWANLSAIREGLDQISKNKPSHCNGSGPVEKIEKTGANKGLQLPSGEARISSAAKKGASQSANQAQSPHVANSTSSQRSTAMSNSQLQGADR
jgi:hypothetical protein